MELTHDGDEQGEDHLDQDYDVLSDDLLQNAPDPIQPPNGSCHKSTAPLQPQAPNPHKPNPISSSLSQTWFPNSTI